MNKEQKTESLENENDSGNDFNTTLNSTLVANGPNNFITQRTTLNYIEN